MAYPSGTILEKNEKVGTKLEARVDADGEEYNVAVVYPYNKIKVVGPSPVRGTETLPEWTGIDGDQFIITPESEFGATQVAPESVLQRDYTVVSYPDETTLEINPEREQQQRIQRLKSPEQLFAEEAVKAAKAKAEEAKEKTAAAKAEAAEAKKVAAKA